MHLCEIITWGRCVERESSRRFLTKETASKAKRWGGAGGSCTQSSPDGEATSTGCRCTTEEKATKQKDTFEKEKRYNCLTFTTCVLNITLTPKRIDHWTTCSLAQRHWIKVKAVIPHISHWQEICNLSTQQKEYNFALILITYNLIKRTETPLIECLCKCWYLLTPGQFNAMLTLAKSAIGDMLLPGCGPKRESPTRVGGTKGPCSEVKARHFILRVKHSTHLTPIPFFGFELLMKAQATQHHS